MAFQGRAGHCFPAANAGQTVSVQEQAGGYNGGDEQKFHGIDGIDDLQIYRDSGLIFKKRTNEVSAGTGVYPEK